MRTGSLFVLALLAAGCGLRSGGRRLPDGGTAGTAMGCNLVVTDGNRVLDAPGAAFANINALSFDAEGKLYVLNRTSSASWVTVFGPAPEHDFLETVGRDVLHDAVDFAREADGSFWVLQDATSATTNPEVVRLSSSGVRLSGFEITVSEVGGLALAADGTLFVSVGRLARFSRDGMVLKVFGDKQPYIPHYQGLAFDSLGRLWATELNERTLEQFELAGDRIGRFGGHGPELGKFDGTTDVHGGPTDLAFDAKGDLYANDPLGSRIQKFSRQGTPLKEFGFGGATNVEPIAVDPRTGNVYVGRDTGVDIVCPL